MTSAHSLFDITGKVAVITGATGTLGAASATAFAEAGARLVLAEIEEEPLAALTQKLEGMGAEVEPVLRRPSTPEDCTAIVEAAVARFGRIDIHCYLGGANEVDAITDFSLERYQKVMDANTTGPWMMCQALGRKLIAQGNGGKVIIVSSTRAKAGLPDGYTAYCASKAAVEGMVRALACEWGKYRINVNALAPTLFRTPLTAWMFENDDKAVAAREAMLTRIPLGRLAEAEDFAGALLFLASPASDFVTGHALAVDGGYLAE